MAILRKVNTKILWPYPLLLGFFSLSSIFYPVLQVNEKMNVELSEINILYASFLVVEWFLNYKEIIQFFVPKCLKGTTKLYFTHYSCLVIILLNTGLCRSEFSVVSFRKLVFRLSVLSVFFVLRQMFWTKTLKYVLS